MENKNSLTKEQSFKGMGKGTFSAYITGARVKAKINQMLAGKDGGRFIAGIISAVSNNPALAECDHATILSAALVGESLKLSPSVQLGQYYLVPFNDNKLGRKAATFQIGYKGYIQLAIRSGQYRKINVLTIKEGELVKFDPLNEEIEVNLIDDEEKREAAKTVGYYAMFEYVNGFRKAMYWSRKKMESHALK
jgi:recombination protein RecT